MRWTSLTARIVCPLRQGNLLMGMWSLIPSDRMSGALSRVFLRTAERLKEYVSYINALAYRNSLTGLKNRIAYMDASEEMKKRMNRFMPAFGLGDVYAKAQSEKAIEFRAV